MRRYLLSAVMILAFASCERMPEMSDIEEIGSPQKEVVVEYESGTTSVQIMSNGEFTATIPSGAGPLIFMYTLQQPLQVS